ncbi:MAG TPA: GNAT family N-acetyltransferase [Gaiellaceae bacterium]
MNVREATPADQGAVLELFRSMDWDRPWPRPEIGPEHLEGDFVLVAEDEGEIVGCAFGKLARRGHAHLNIVCVRPESRRRGAASALVAEFAAQALAAGSEHVTLDVDLTNEVGQMAWQRLGFTEYSKRLYAPAAALEARAGPAESGESYASLHVQTDDVASVEAAAAKYLPRFGGGEARVAGPLNGWSVLYSDLTDRDRQARQRLASELSNATGAVVCVLAVEAGRVVRFVLYERGSIVDEYQSVPEYFGPLPPGDVIALAANPTVIARLTGADRASVRAVARTASSPDDLPPAEELLAQIAEVMGLQGAGRG